LAPGGQGPRRQGQGQGPGLGRPRNPGPGTGPGTGTRTRSRTWTRDPTRTPETRDPCVETLEPCWGPLEPFCAKTRGPVTGRGFWNTPEKPHGDPKFRGDAGAHYKLAGLFPRSVKFPARRTRRGLTLSKAKFAPRRGVKFAPAGGLQQQVGATRAAYP